MGRAVLLLCSYTLEPESLPLPGLMSSPVSEKLGGAGAGRVCDSISLTESSLVPGCENFTLD